MLITRLEFNLNLYLRTVFRLEMLQRNMLFAKRPLAQSAIVRVQFIVMFGQVPLQYRLGRQSRECGQPFHQRRQTHPTIGDRTEFRLRFGAVHLVHVLAHRVHRIVSDRAYRALEDERAQLRESGMRFGRVNDQIGLSQRGGCIGQNIRLIIIFRVTNYAASTSDFIT